MKNITKALVSLALSSVLLTSVVSSMEGVEQKHSEPLMSSNEAEIQRLIEIIKGKITGWQPVNRHQREQIVGRIQSVLLEHIPISPEIQPRSFQEYIQQTAGKHRIMVIGGGRTYGYDYPENAYLVNISSGFKPDTIIDITKPNNIPHDLYNQFDFVIWERVDGHHFFNPAALQNVKNFLKAGGMLIANNIMHFENKEEILGRRQSHAEKVHQPRQAHPLSGDEGLEGLLQEIKPGSGLWRIRPDALGFASKSHHIYYSSQIRQYSDAAGLLQKINSGTATDSDFNEFHRILKNVAQNTFDILIYPLLESIGFKGSQLSDRPLHWYSGNQPGEEYIIAIN
jgi:hypothetical protein